MNNNLFLISIIVTSYNIKKYIKEALESCFIQDYSNIELICIDDGSDDGTFELILDIIKNETRIKQIILSKKENGGPNSARKEGLKYANGDYIFFMDGDDILPANSISSLANELNDQLYDIVFAPFKIITSKKNDSKIFNYNITKGSSGIKALETYIYKPKAIWGKLIKRSLFIDNNIDYALDFKIGEDAALMTQLLYYSNSISECRNIAYIYRAQRINSLYSQYGNNNNYTYILPSVLFISNYFKNNNLTNNPIYFNYFHSFIYRYLIDKKNINNNDKDIQTIINNIPFKIIPKKDKITIILYLLSKNNIKLGRLFLLCIEKCIEYKRKIIK